MRPQKSKRKTKKTNRKKGKNTKTRDKKSQLRPNKRNNLNNSDNYLYSLEQSTDYPCYDIKEPKSIKDKTTRIFAIIGHSSLCTHNDLIKIKENREPDKFRVDLMGISSKFKKVRYVSAQDVGRMSSVMRVEEFIKQLRNNEKIYSGLIQIDDIKSAKNLSRAVDCDLQSTNPSIYNKIKRRYKDSETMKFNVYPKKDRNGTQNPINSSYDFILNSADDVFAGIYELTTDRFMNEYNNDNNNDNSYSLGIEYDDILYNSEIKKAFWEQRDTLDKRYNRQLRIYRSPTQLETAAGMGVTFEDLQNTAFAKLKGSLMIPDRNTEGELMSSVIGWDESEFLEFTRFNKKLFELCMKRNKFSVKLDDIIRIILNDNDTRYEDDIIILDFGCNHISDMQYSNNIYERPTMDRESTIKIPASLKKEMGVIREPGDYRYYTNRLFEETK